MQSLFIHNILSTKQSYMAKCVCVWVCIYYYEKKKNEILFCTKQSKTICKLKIINFLQFRNNLQLNNKVSERERIVLIFLIINKRLQVLHNCFHFFTYSDNVYYGQQQTSM